MTPSRPVPRGFTLIEALVAVALVGLGLLALAMTQLKLSQGVDLARQRGEATRLAQQRIEALRSYVSIDNAGGGAVSWDGLVGGTDQASTSATFTRSWTLAGSSADLMRQVNVTVDWTDRAGRAQAVSLDSLIARTDPSEVGSLGFPLPDNTTLKRPKNRNLNIPVPARDLGDGQSVTQINNTFAVVFSNNSGYVVKTCGFVVTNASDLSRCTATNAYIVAGYLSMNGSGALPGGLALNLGLLSGVTGTTCAVSDAVNQTSGAVIAGYKYYLCVVSVATQGQPWAGRVRLAGMASGTDYLVCRFQYPSSNGVTTNQRNVQPYTGVTESLDNQNYVLTTASSCPTVSGLATTLHQACRSSNPNANANRSSDCPVT